MKTATIIIKENKFLYFYLLVIFILFSHTPLFAQSKLTSKEYAERWEVGIGGGTSLFFGDIKQNPVIPINSYVNEWRWAGEAYVGYNISPVFKLLFQVVYGTLSGTRRNWNVYFDAEYFETNLVLNVNFNNLFGKKNTHRPVSIFGVLGMGIMQHNTAVKNLQTSEVKNIVGYGYGSGIGGMTLEGVITYGLGMNILLNDFWAIRVQSVNRAINTDRLDGFENDFPYDVYNITSIGIVYKFGKYKQNVKKIKKIKVNNFNKK